MILSVDYYNIDPDPAAEPFDHQWGELIIGLTLDEALELAAKRTTRRGWPYALADVYPDVWHEDSSIDVVEQLAWDEGSGWVERR